MRAISSSTRRRPRASRNTLTDEAARLLGGKGEFAIITGALSAANQNEWIAFIKKRLAEKYPEPQARDHPSERRRPRQGVRRDPDDHAGVSGGEAGDGDLGAGGAGSAEAVRQADRRDVNVIGLSLPNINKPYVHDGWVQTVVLWNTRDLGYLTVLSPVRCWRRKGSRRAARRSTPGASARFRSGARKSSWARRRCSPRRTLTSSTSSSKVRWAVLWTILIAVVLVPFLIFEKQFEALATWLAAGNASGWATAGAIGALLALDVFLPVPSSIVSTGAGVLLGLLDRRGGHLDRDDARLRDRVCVRRIRVRSRAAAGRGAGAGECR